MSLYLRVINENETEEILEFERAKLNEQFTNEHDRIFESWSAKWRQESLEHYLRLGWSYLIKDKALATATQSEGALVGYLIAQPLLFFDGQTQSLWVEHIQYSTIQVRDELCQLAIKLAREKHFQRVYFPNQQAISNSINTYKPESFDAKTIFIKTTK